MAGWEAEARFIPTRHPLLGAGSLQAPQHPAGTHVSFRRDLMAKEPT